MSYSSEVIASAPYLYLRLNDASGSTVADSSGNGKTGSVSGAAGLTFEQTSIIPTTTDKCLKFPGGTGSYLYNSAAQMAGLTGASAITLETFYKPEVVTGYTKYLARIIGFGFTAFEVYVNTGGYLVINASPAAGDTNNTHTTTGHTAIAAGNVYHLVVVADFANDKILAYINGTKVADVSKTWTATTVTMGISNANLTYYGYLTGSASGPYGWVDDLAIYGKALSGSEVSAHYLAGTQVVVSPPAGTVALNSFVPLILPMLVPAGAVALTGFNPQAGHIRFPDFGTVAISGMAPSLSGNQAVPSASIAVSGFVPNPTVETRPGFGTVALSGKVPSLKGDTKPTAGSVAISGKSPARYVWEPPAVVSWQMVYTLTLTGAADGQSDVVLPMASFQSRARAAAQTYLGVVVPWTTAYAAAIALRPNGTLVIAAGPRYADGTENLTIMLRATLDRVDVDRGPKNSSITLHGYYAASTLPVQTRNLSGVSYVRTGETNQIRSSVDIWVRPGDTAVDPTTGTSVSVDTITYVISPSRQEMTVADAGI